MTPKRLRYIAHLMRAGMCAGTATTEATAAEVDLHADELEKFLEPRGGKQLPVLVKLREPEPPPGTFSLMAEAKTQDAVQPGQTVFGDLKRTFPKASEGMR